MLVEIARLWHDIIEFDFVPVKTGIFDMRLTEENLAINAKNRKWRTLKKEQERLQDSDS